MIFRLCLLCTLLLSGINLRAREGVVETSDGKTFEGDVRLESGGLIISATNQTATNIELARISLFRFQVSAPDASSSTGLVHGLRGTYFSNPDLTGSREVRIDAEVN